LTFVVDGSEEIFDVLAGLCKELKKISGMLDNRLESIQIVIDFRDEEDDLETGDIWRKLETVLLHSGWPKLKYFSLSFIIYRTNDGPFKAALECLWETQFARLISGKNFDVQFSICEEKEPYF
jgi:hypothetical protein